MNIDTENENEGLTHVTKDNDDLLIDDLVSTAQQNDPSDRLDPVASTSDSTMEGVQILEPPGASRQVLQVEVVQKDRSNFSHSKIQKLVETYIRRFEYINTHLVLSEFNDVQLQEHVEAVQLCHDEKLRAGNSDNRGIHLPSTDMQCYVFKLNRNGPDVEEIAENGEEDAPASSNWLLPSSDLQGIWENLVYDTNIKEDLLKFVETSLLLADRNVDNNVISCNRVVLLHGPPGTGKTSLCKALAQKLTIRLSKRYSHGLLIEINSHSLFSKWFSESGKLVLKMFTEIKSHIDDPRALICVLIDEVESLTSARKNSMSGSEPSDAVRVVNALLTQIDSIKHLPNVLILTTSNITGAVDLAFVDRADIKQYVGLPTTGAIYQIYYSCIQELEKKKIVKYDGVPLLSLRSLQVCNFCSGQSTSPSLNLWKVAEASGGLSGRTLRKIPILALALFCSSHDPDRLVGLGQFVEAMRRAVERQFADREDLAKS